jgi:hypothetical protein
MMAHLYYTKHIGSDDQRHIIEEVFRWLSMSAAEHKDLPVFKEKYACWQFLGDEYPHWSKLAIFFLSVVTQSATCERIFKDWARFHTDSRNRLNLATTERLVQLRKFQQANYKKRNNLEPDSVKHRIIASSELEKLPNRDTTDIAEVSEGHDDSEDETEMVPIDDRFSHLEQENAFVIIQNWKSTIDAINSVSEEEEFEEEVAFGVVPGLSTLETNGEDDRRPWPVGNDKSFPQENLARLPVSNLRTCKTTLAEWFANDVEF